MLEDRFALAPVGRGAILLDTFSGAILELNESATFVWERKLNGESTEAIVEALASRYGVPPAAVIQDVDRALSPILETGVAEYGDFRYERTPSGYAFTFRGQTVFELDDGGHRLKLSNDVGEMLSSLLRALAPKLLALRGDLVLHASAVELNGKIIAFTGSSGAGKTTTARALADASGRIVCEDQLWISIQNATTVASMGGERGVSTWVADALVDLRRLGEIECLGLSAAAREGGFLPLAEIGFLDVRWRVGDHYVSKELRPWESAGLVFRNAFHGSDERRSWVRQLESAARIGSGTVGVQLVLPDGLDRLAAIMRGVGATATLRS